MAIERTTPRPVRIRHYCQGIGDCHLLRLEQDDGRPYVILIDCGVHTSVKGGPQTIQRIVEDIASETDRIDLLVLTHEHWDHVSGFLTAADTFAQLTIGEVWMGWTENPADPQARQLDKFKEQALSALQAASQQFARTRTLDGYLSSVRDGVEALMGFNFGAKGERVRAARNAAAALAPQGVRYLEPHDEPLTLPGLPGLRVYVLGPPRDKALLGVTVRASEMYGMSGPAWGLAAALRCGVNAGLTAGNPGEDPGAPFDANVGHSLRDLLGESADGGQTASERALRAFVRDHYAGPVSAAPGTKARRSSDPNKVRQDWRRIDNDWLGASAELAMQLDNRTNNTSLVLAFEFTDTQRVLLFAADAQVGSWLSWQDLSWTVDGTAVSAADLLARTVYYKVAHHGSENATLKAKGLELMTSKDLTAFIPTHAADAAKVGWRRMPFDAIVTALDARTAGRVVRADDPWLVSTNVDPPFRLPSGSLHGLRHQAGLWVEFDVA